MANIVTYVSNKLSPYVRIITILFIVIVFVFSTYYFYVSYFKNSKYNVINRDGNMTDIANKAGTNSIELHMYYVTWCPYCRTALPVYRSIEQKYKNQPVNNQNVIFVEMDITNTENAVNKTVIDKYDITSYPTIFIIDSTGKRINYDAKVTQDNLDKFIHSV